MPQLVPGEIQTSATAGLHKHQRPVSTGAWRDRGLGLATVLLFLTGWQILVSFRVVNPLFLGSPLGIGAAFWKMLHGGQLGRDVRVSGTEFLVGYVVSAVIGIPLGIALGWYRALSVALQPFISGFYATPTIALLPLVIIWFGIGIASKVVVIFLVTVFQILMNTATGVRSLDNDLIAVARSYGATDGQIFRTLALPGAVPFILSGLRLAVGLSLIGVFVGELYASNAGVGHLIATAGETFNTNQMFVGVVIIALAGIVFIGLLQRLENRFQSWRPARNR